MLRTATLATLFLVGSALQVDAQRAPDVGRDTVETPLAQQEASLSPRPNASRFLAWAGGDALAGPRSINGRHLAYVAATVGSIALMTLADSELSGNAGLDRRRDVGPILNTANELGNTLYVGSAAAGLFAASLLTNNTRLQDAAFTSLQSAIYTNIATTALKGAVGRARPYTLEGPHEFEPFSGHRAMPSGHTSLAFAVTVPWAVYYPGPATYGLVALAGGTAIARVARGDHWASDVVAGAAVGGAIGYLLARRHIGEDAPSLIAKPILSPGVAGLSLSLQF